jgi:hypothetical protein
MKIKLSPQRRNDTLTVTKKGDILTINNIEYDFSVIPDGATLPNDATDCAWLASDVERIDGVLNLTLILPSKANASEAARFPQPIINPADGILELPQ